MGTDQVMELGGAGVSQLAALTGQDKSQVSRTLRTLAEAGLVDRDPQTLLYRIGWQMFALGTRGGDQQLITRAAPLLASIVARTGERAHLSVLRGSGVLTVLTESPAHSLQSVSWVGRIVPCHTTSSGRALLLDHDRDQLRTLLGTGPLARYGPNCPADVDDLFARITLARARGVVLVDEEFEVGLVAVSAPVRNATGRIVAAVNISGPKFRLADRLDEACVTVITAAAELSQQLRMNPTRTTRTPDLL